MGLATAVSIIGTAVGAVGSIAQGQQQQEWANYNAAIAQQQAQTAKATAEWEATQKRKETERLLGKQRALYGVAGVTYEGSPLELMAETAAEGELDALMLERTGKIREQKYMSEAELTKMKGQQAATAGYFGAGTTLLTGASKLYKATGTKVK